MTMVNPMEEMIKNAVMEAVREAVREEVRSLVAPIYDHLGIAMPVD